jgi:hypothetical protein
MNNLNGHRPGGECAKKLLQIDKIQFDTRGRRFHGECIPAYSRQSIWEGHKVSMASLFHHIPLLRIVMLSKRHIDFLTTPEVYHHIC